MRNLPLHDYLAKFPLFNPKIQSPISDRRFPCFFFWGIGALFPFFFLVESLFELLNVNSNGNFHHFKKIFLFLLKRNDTLLYEYLLHEICPHISKPNIFRLLPFLHQSTIQDCIFSSIFNIAVSELKYIRKERFTCIMEMEFIKTLLELVDSEYQELSEGAAYLFSIIVQEASKIEDSSILFMSLGSLNHLFQVREGFSRSVR